jgi:SAM-dependent methyltransferase
MADENKKPDYGVDAPGVIRNLLVVGFLGLVLFPFVPPITVGEVTIIMTPSLLGAGIGCTLGGVLMLIYAKVGKFGHRDRMLKMVAWRGDEQVLDVGTGAGLLMIGSAKKLTSGKATGVDLWSQKDLSNNGRQKTLENAELEGVKERVEVVDGDATEMKFADATFDVIVSNLCIHNIPSEAGRDKACREIVRVLKPGGVVVISDFIHTRRYQRQFEQAGLKIAPETGMTFATFPPLRVIKATK